MPYTPQNWVDGAGGGTPISAARLNHIESGIAAAAVVYNVKDYGAKGDGTTDDTSSIQNAATAAAGGTLYFPNGTFRTTGTINLTAATNLRFAGRSSVLKYVGTADAIQATTFKGLVIDGAGIIDLSGAGTNAVGIHIAGVWDVTISDMKITQGPANSTGVLIETGTPGSTAYYGSFCININNLDLLDGNGLYGIRTMKTAADTNPQDAVTHLIINNGWSKGKNTGLYLVNASTVFVNGFCVDTAYNGYYIEKSSGVVLKPGEIGPVSNWAITFGTTANEANGVVVLAPSYVGVSGVGQKGYLDTTLMQPTVFDMSTMALRGSAGGTAGSELYYTVMQSLYNAAKSFSWRIRGGGAELEVMSWNDAGGLVINGGVRTTFNSDVYGGNVFATAVKTSSGDLALTPASGGSVRPSRLVQTPVALTDGATISTDCSAGNFFTVTLGGNRTLASPASAVDGQVILYRLKQDATGGRTITWGPTFRFPGAAPTLSTAAGKNDYIEFMWNAADAKFDCIRTVIGL